MSTSQRRIPKGFTLIEFMIVISILAIIMMLVIPNLLNAGDSKKNDLRAVAILKQIAAAQADAKVQKLFDNDSDGVGEYGSLWQLYQAKSRTGRAIFPQPRLEFNKIGIAFRQQPSYAFYVMVSETDPDVNEQSWVAYAWPTYQGGTALTFRLDWQGELTATPALVFDTNGSALPSEELAGRVSWEAFDPDKNTEASATAD